MLIRTCCLRVNAITRLVASLGLATALVSCGDHPSPQRNEPKPEAVIEVKKNPDGSTTISMGAKLLRVPANRQPMRIDDRVVAWQLTWPTLETHGDDHRRIIYVYMIWGRQGKVPFPFLDPNSTVRDIETAGFEGPFASDISGLAEFRDAKGEPRVYILSNTEYVYPESGVRPVLRCDGTRAMKHQSHCTASVFLTSDIRYQYSFSRPLVPEWIVVDEAVREFIVGMTASTARADSSSVGR